MKATFLSRVTGICACAFLLLSEAKAQDGKTLLNPEYVKAGFLQQEGFEQQLTAVWSQDNELVWTPQWDAIFAAQLEGKDVQLVPLLPSLHAANTHQSIPFELLGARKFLLVTGEGSAATYQVVTLLYDEKKNSLSKLKTTNILKTFSGTILRQAIGKTYMAASAYENGKPLVAENLPGSNKNGSPLLSKTDGTNGTNGTNGTSATNGVICEIRYTCYWSAFCATNNVTYGTITRGTGYCNQPNGIAGPCYNIMWTQTGSDSTPDCRYDYTSADINPDWGPGP